MNSVAFYQPGDSAAGDRERLTLQLVPDLSDAVDLIVLFPDTLGFKAQIPVPFGAIRRQVRVSGDRYMRIKCGLGDWQNLRARLKSLCLNAMSCDSPGQEPDARHHCPCS